MPKITDIQPRELSLIFGEHKGERWQPVNQDSLILSVKGQPAKEVSEEEKKSWLANLWDKVKAWYISDGSYGPTTDESLNAAASLIYQMYYDLQNASCISNDNAREAAVTSIIKEFFDTAGTIGVKAGKRHSASDQAHIDAVTSLHDKVGKSLDAAQKAHDAMDDHLQALGSQAATEDDPDDAKARLVVVVDATKAEPIVEVGDPGEDGSPATFKVTAVSEAAAKGALTEWLSKADKEPYGDVEYADNGLQSDGKKRYPIDTAAHAKADWSYINQDKNASKYSADDLKKVKDKIRAACKKFDIEISDDKGAIVTQPSTADNGEAIATAVDAAKAEIKAIFQTQLDEAIAKAKTDSDAAVAAVKSESEAKIATLQSELATANELVKGIVHGARKPTSPGAVPTMNEDGSHTDPADPDGTVARAERAKAVADDKTLTPIGKIIAAQRIATS